MVFEFLRKKKKEIEEPEERIEEGLPEELERFRAEPKRQLGKTRPGGPSMEVSMGEETEFEEPSAEDKTPFLPPDIEESSRKPIPSYKPFKRPEPEPEPETTHELHKDKIELILSKLDTIDARLRVIEEKLKTRSSSYL